MPRPRLIRALGVLALAATALLSGCTSAADDGDEVVIVCATCQQSATDPFLQFNYDAAQRFNAAHVGRIRVQTVQNANAGSSDGRLQYYQRLALADDLPDLFQLNSAEIADLSRTGALHDFAPDLAAAPQWADTFQDHAFDALSGPDGQTWAIPQQRDPIGVFYNTTLLRSVGIETLPGTWDEFEAAGERLKAAGHHLLALDGDWATMLMWTNLIGTHPHGTGFLATDIATADSYAGFLAAVEATERLRRWHTTGYVNTDAFSGDFQNAASAYLSNDAAAIPNGPWFVRTNLKGSAAAPGLAAATRYVPSPGWTADQRGLIVVSGAGWVSGTTDEINLAAVTEFLRFATTPDEMLEQARRTGSNPPTNLPAATLQAAGLDPLVSGLTEAAADVPLIYPHVRVHGPGGFGRAWKNLWPAYVNGAMDTATFLSRLAHDSRPGSR